MPYPISQSVAVYQTIRNRIIATENAIDEATLADTLEGLTDFHEVIAAVVRTALFQEAMADGLKAHLKALHERLTRLQDSAAALRQLARDAMIEVDVRKVAAPDFTVTLRPGTASAVVEDESALPSDYWQAQKPKLDRARLLSDLNLGLPIQGACLSDPEPVLSVRTR